MEPTLRNARQAAQTAAGRDTEILINTLTNNNCLETTNIAAFLMTSLSCGRMRFSLRSRSLSRSSSVSCTAGCRPARKPVARWASRRTPAARPLLRRLRSVRPVSARAAYSTWLLHFQRRDSLTRSAFSENPATPAARAHRGDGAGRHWRRGRYQDVPFRPAGPARRCDLRAGRRRCGSRPPPSGCAR